MSIRRKLLPPRQSRTAPIRSEPPVPVLSRAEYATLREEIIQHASSYASYDGTFTAEEYADAMLKNLTVEPHD